MTPDVRSFVAVHARQRRRHHDDRRIARGHLARRAPARQHRRSPGFDLNGDGDILDHRPLLLAQQHQHQALGRHHLADLGHQRRQPPALRLHLGSRAPSADRRSGATSKATARSKTSSPAARASACSPPTATSSAAAIASRSPSSKQYALEYRGQFLDDKFTATVGVRAPFFTRELNQYCYTPNGGTGNSATRSAPHGGTLCTVARAARRRSPMAT